MMSWCPRLEVQLCRRAAGPGISRVDIAVAHIPGVLYDFYVHRLHLSHWRELCDQVYMRLTRIDIHARIATRPGLLRQTHPKRIQNETPESYSRPSPYSNILPPSTRTNLICLEMVQSHRHPVKNSHRSHTPRQRHAVTATPH